MSFEVIDQLDDILAETPGALMVEDIGDLLFGGPLRRLPLEEFFDAVIESGTALRKHQGLPLAVPVPQEIGFFLIAWVVERLQDEMIGAGAKGIDKVTRRMEKIERRHGVDEMILPWKVSDAPPAWQAANQEWERIADEIFFDALKPYSADMAALFRNDSEEFDRRREVGRLNFARLLGRDDVLESTEKVLAEVSEEQENE